MTPPRGGIAVVGIDCRLPGAPTVDDFWRLLIDGRTAAGPVPADRWDPARVDGAPPGVTLPAAFLADVAGFDHGFFGISPAEAAAMDPQQRLLLQATWRAVEDAGHDPRALAGTATGVYVGMMSSEWGTLHLSDYRGMTAHRGSGNGYCMAANRISYHLDLKGPSMAVDTACSSSLVATQLAATALQAGEVDIAIAAGVNLILTPALSIFYAQAGLAAPDGRCKPFADGADGIGRGEGVGVVVLRRLSDALADKQRVYAVIEGGAVGSDGRSNGLTAPNRFAQAGVIRRAHDQAGIEPSAVSFVEGHGTGTRLGDMIEVRALGDVHAGRQTPALLGSVKANLGHLEGAAGITGLIKACLALERRTLPGMPAGEENPELRLADHGFRLATTASRLPAGTVHAGVSSFGLGGTNAHLVLSSPPRTTTPAPREPEAAVLTVTAATTAALAANLTELRAAVAAEVPGRVAQLAWSSTVVKRGLRHRAAVGGVGRDGLLTALDRVLGEQNGHDAGSAPRIALVFTGQGSQFPAMTAALYRHCPPYRQQLDRVSAAIGELPGGTLVELLLSGADLEPTALAQPALFALSYALAATLLELGVQPVAAIGHSVGEFAAACAAGALDLADAARLVTVRGSLMQALPGGGAMAAARLSAAELTGLLGPDLGARDGEVLDVAASNGPRSVTVSGSEAAVERAAAAIRAAGTAVTRLAVSHAFHSGLMRPMVGQFAAVAEKVPAGTPRFPLLSTVRHGDSGAETLTTVDGSYWTEQICAPVRFADAADALAALAPTHVVEVGPRPVLLGLLRGILGPHTALACSPGPRADGGELAAVVAALWRDGADVALDRWYTPAARVRRRLPGYVFDIRTEFWFDPGAAPAARVHTTADTGYEATTVSEPAASGVADLVRAAIRVVSGHDDAALHPQAELADLGFDSIMAMRFVDELEPRIGPLDLEALLPHLTTVGSLITHFERAHPAPEGAPA
ncbi:beta-ketoacyl synthase N-terminal-like domain-containing protein [Saccharomonospora sp. NPDC046836]|uniref:type I polyketide synthase n=1 Tax=Saccharomonospora sp. NPDC046836 TaxID=3156921 RepID=UPI0033E1D0E2